ncbi:unnamed protein product [Prunus armeniaca]|uniref:Uncharacterized protein n=1 Tax=Prunus armeniaca TaxID=36596 RepID=A0A6J5TD27_PRUAR|nr:unnamed protein product [Prunus armeniaca]
MGCFLACFGFSKKKKRRKPGNKVAAAGDQGRGSYVPLDSSLTIIGVDGAKESLRSAGSELRDKPKEQTRFKIRKKVSFNLNVQTYEPISTGYHFLESDEEEEVEKNGQEVSKGSLSTSASQRDSTTLRMGLFPSNYRYQNVRDSYDEDDHIADEESDLDDNYNDIDDDDDSEIDDQRISQEGFSRQFCSSSIKRELECPNARGNIQYVHSVLSPVENLTQWKAAKAKAAAPKQQKENIAALSQEPRMPPSSRSSYNQSKPLLQEIPVHASLSSWLNSQSTN